MRKSIDTPSVMRALMTLMVVMMSSCCGVNVIDLTHQLKEGESITWPANPRYNFTILTRGHTPAWKNLWLESNKFAVAEHTGTHMDAPSHLRKAKGGWRVHQIPAERLVGPGVMVDVREKVKENPVYKTTVDDLKEWESQHGQIPDKAVVLVNTGWAIRYPNWNRVFGTDNFNDLNSLKYPSVTPDAARWLAEKRNIIALGIDSPGSDLAIHGQVPVHWILLGKNIMLLENVANVNRLPPTGTTIVMGVLNIYDGSGGPMRLLALRGDVGSGGCKLQSAAPLSFFIVVISLGMSLIRTLNL